MADQAPIRILVFDLRMGIRRRGEFPNARIILLITYAGDPQVLRALNAGARVLVGDRRSTVDRIPKQE